MMQTNGMVSRLAGLAGGVCLVFALLAIPTSVRADEWEDCFDLCGDPTEIEGSWDDWYDCMDTCSEQHANQCYPQKTSGAAPCYEKAGAQCVHGSYPSTCITAGNLVGCTCKYVPPPPK